MDMTSTPNTTAEQIIEETINRGVPDKSYRGIFKNAIPTIVRDLRAHGLLSEGAPSEEQVRRGARAIAEQAGLLWDFDPSDPGDVYMQDARAVLAATSVAPQEPSDAWVDRQLAAEVAAKIGAPAPFPDREKLIAEAQKRAKKRRAAGWLAEADMLDRLIGALAAQPVLDPEKVAEVLLLLMRDEAMLFDNGTEEWIAESDPVECLPPLARALCEAAKRGELNAE